MAPYEFDCADCKSHVFSYGERERERTRCHNCNFVRSMALDADGEKELRELLGCSQPTEEGEKT